MADDQRATGIDPGIRRVSIIGASGKLCREQSVGKLAEFEGRITVVPGATNDREVIRRAVAAATAC